MNEKDQENAEEQEHVSDHDKTLTDGQASAVLCNQTSGDLYENVDSTSVNITPITPAVFCGESQDNVASTNGTDIDEHSKVAAENISEKELGVVTETPITNDDKSDTTCSTESEEGSDQCEENSFVFERNVTVKIRQDTERVYDNVERAMDVDVDVTREEITDSESYDLSTQNRHLKLVDYEVSNSDRSGEPNKSQPKVSETESIDQSLKPDLNCEDLKESILDTENIKEEPNDDYEQQTVTETNSETVAVAKKTSKILSMYESPRTEDTVDTLNDDRKYI